MIEHYPTVLRANRDGLVAVVDMFEARGARLEDYWPLAGQENRRKGVIPEGTFVRIKASMSDNEIAARVAWIPTPEGRGQAATLARALRDYGAFIGDNGGSSSRLRLEAGRAWALPADALKNFQFRAGPLESDWEFVEGGYDPPMAPAPAATPWHGADSRRQR